MIIYVAREKDGTLEAFENSPIYKKDTEEWVDIGWQDTGAEVCCLGCLPKSWMPEIKPLDPPVAYRLEKIEEGINFRLSEKTKAILERDSGKTIEEIQRTPLKDLINGRKI